MALAEAARSAPAAAKLGDSYGRRGPPHDLNRTVVRTQHALVGIPGLRIVHSPLSNPVPGAGRISGADAQATRHVVATGDAIQRSFMTGVFKASGMPGVWMQTQRMVQDSQTERRRMAARQTSAEAR
jgi:hypothetical protein